MADQKISALSSGSPAALGDELVIARSGANYKLTIAQLLIGAELDYVEKTSSTTVTATTDATANAVIDGNAVSFDGSTRAKIEFWAMCCSLANNSEVIFNLYDGSTDLGRIGAATNEAATGGATGDVGPIYCVRFLTPSNASHTYHIKAWKANANTVSVTAGAGGTATSLPCWYRITKA